MSFRRLLEFAKIGTLTKKCYDIIVWTNDSGNIPHFHIIDSNTQGNIFNSCIRIDKAEYFNHEGKTDKLNSQLRKDLVNFLLSTDEDLGISNWILLVSEWNRNNSNIKININTQMPDYIKLK